MVNLDRQVLDLIMNPTPVLARHPGAGRERTMAIRPAFLPVSLEFYVGLGRQRVSIMNDGPVCLGPEQGISE